MAAVLSRLQCVNGVRYVVSRNLVFVDSMPRQSNVFSNLLLSGRCDSYSIRLLHSPNPVVIGLSVGYKATTKLFGLSKDKENKHDFVKTMPDK